MKKWALKLLRTDGTSTIFLVVAYRLNTEDNVIELNIGADRFVFINWADIRQVNIEPAGDRK